MSSDAKPKVLLIDDEEFLLTMYSTKFLKSGFDVYVCDSADKGIAALKGGYVPDAILFDVTMPVKSGYEFLEELKKISLPKSCLKIALTNEGQDNEKERLMELGIDAHLLKAKYTPHELVPKVAAMIDEKRRWFPGFHRASHV